ncbi:39S ribosomal protein L43, mitochondrial [Schistocerca gregaria]|uniref:39S ribosomal protein L43, mitochondrial n=1 Tax=Schistocerca gregaria TaxID=7010 RepID=UPI00211F06BE|nr:39S ribosomal protein L43, mitochondrial [Schistocerca gregaria]
MSNSHLFLPSGFPRAPLGNGLGRYICQLQRITIKFCKNHGASRGVREFIECDLIDFARKNPQTVVYVKPRRHRSPVIKAEYLNGENHHMSVHNFTLDEIRKWISVLCTQNQGSFVRYRKMWHTDHPSIQGVWNPFTHRQPELNKATFPQEELSSPQNLPPTATDLLLEMFKKQKLSEEDSRAVLEEKRAE